MIKSLYVVSIISGFAFSTLASADTISIRADEWCPYNCNPKEGPRGFMIEIAEELLSKASHKVDYATMPWPRAIEDARNNKINAIVGANKNDAPDFIFPEVSLGENKSCIFVNQSNNYVYDASKSEASLAKIKLGIIKDYSYSDNIDPYIQKNKNDEKHISTIAGDDALKRLMKLVKTNRIDAFVENENVYGYNAKKEGAEFKNSGCDPAVEVFIAFSPKNPKSKDYAKILSDGVVSMRKSGELKKILAKYNLNDWKK